TSRLEGSDADTVEKVMDAGLAALQDRSEIVPFEVEEHSGLLGMKYSQALMDGNRRNAEEVVEQGLDDGLHMVDVAVDIVQPAMYEIGYLWQANRITVAQEHLATAISQNALARAFIRSEFEAPNGRTALLSCVEGNHHQLGLRMVSDALETKGWEVNYLGADTPTNDLIKHIDKVSPDTLALSVSMPYQLLELTKLTEIINSNFAGKAPVVIIGGLALNTHPMLTKKLWGDYHFVDARTLLEELN
ncbi:MAG: B12-binding domain-containing protein, partial [Motiliproteus sp.]|nr:B12-binding domain-containing protein [Motiliproteus sp.]